MALPQHYVKKRLKIRGLDLIKPGLGEKRVTIRPYNITWTEVIMDVLQTTFNPAMFKVEALRHRRETSGVQSGLDKPVYILLNEYARKCSTCVVYLVRSPMWRPERRHPPSMDPRVVINRLPVLEKPNIKLHLEKCQKDGSKAAASSTIWSIAAAAGSFQKMQKSSTLIGKDFTRSNYLKRLQHVKPSLGPIYPLVSTVGSQAHSSKESGTMRSPVFTTMEAPKKSSTGLVRALLQLPPQGGMYSESLSKGESQPHSSKESRAVNPNPRSNSLSVLELNLPQASSHSSPQIKEAEAEMLLTIRAHELRELMAMVERSTSQFVRPNVIRGQINFFPNNTLDYEFTKKPLAYIKTNEDIKKELISLGVYNPFSSPNITLEKWILSRRSNVRNV